MEKWMIGILCIFLVLGACGAQEAKENLEDQTLDAAKHTGTDLVNQALQTSVNLQCTIGNNIFTIYFLDDKTSVKSATGQTWIVDGYAYTAVKVGQTYYLLKAPVTSTQMDYTTMKDMYYQSKTVQGYTCEEGTVTDNDVTMPNYPTVTNEEYAQKLQEEMMKAYQ